MTCELRPISAGQAELAGELCIMHAAAVQAQLVELLPLASDWEIDLGGITEIDTAGVQLLLATKREAARRGHCVDFVRHSEPVLAVIDLLGLSGEFGDALLLSGEAGHAGASAGDKR